MAEERKIPIRIEATGGDQAAGEFKKVAEAAQEVQQAAANPADFGPGGESGIDDLLAKLDSLRESARASIDGTKELGDQFEETGEKAGDLGDKVGGIASVQKAQAIAEISAKAAAFGRTMQEVAREVEKFDRDAARSLQDTGKAVEDVGGAISNVTMGFAAGGPWGAAAVGLAEALGTLGQAYLEVEAIAAKSQQTILDVTAATAELNATRAAGIKETISEQDLENLAKQNQLLREQTRELEAQLALIREKRQLEGEVNRAGDKKTVAEIDEKESRGEISKEEAARQRAEVDYRSGVREREERRTAAAEDEQMAARRAEAAGQGATNANLAVADREQELANIRAQLDQVTAEREAIWAKINGDGRKPSEQETEGLAGLDNQEAAIGKFTATLEKDLQEARQVAEQARQEAREATRDWDIQRERTGGVNRATTEIDQLESDRYQSQRRGLTNRENARIQQEKDREEDKRLREEDRQKLAKEREQAQIDREAGSIGRDLEKASDGISTISERGRRVLADAGRGIQGGAQGNEAQVLAEMLDRALNHIETRDPGGVDSSVIQGLLRRVQGIERKQSQMEIRERSIANRRTGR